MLFETDAPNYIKKFNASVINLTAFLGVPKDNIDNTPLVIESVSNINVPDFFSISNDTPSFLHFENNSVYFYS